MICMKEYDSRTQQGRYFLTSKFFWKLKKNPCEVQVTNQQLSAKSLCRHWTRGFSDGVNLIKPLKFYKCSHFFEGLLK